MFKYFLSIFFILLFALNSISVIPFSGSNADIELSLDAENKTEQEQKEEKTENEGKEKLPLYTYSTNSLLLTLKGQKNKGHFSNAFIEEVNIKNPTPPPEQA